MKGKSALLAGAAVIALVASAQAGYAAAAAPASSGPSNAELAARLQALEDELQAYEGKSSADHTRLSALEQNFNDTSWSFDNARPTVKSGDGRFTMAFRVRFQFDMANFLQDAPSSASNRDLSSGAVIRRGFFGVEGKAFNDFWYEFRLNAGGSDGGSQGASGVPAAGEGDPLMSLARVAYVGIDHFMLNVGVIEPAFMFEGTTSSGQLMFLERPEIDNIAADTYGAADARRGIEARFQKQGVFKGDDNLVVNVAFTGSKTGSANGHGNGGDEQAQLLGRVSYRAWSDGISNLSFGVSGSDILYSGNTASGGSQVIRLRDRPEIRVDGTRLIDTGNAFNAKTGFMYAFDAGMNYKNFFLGGEWAEFQIDRLSPSGAILSHGTAHPTFNGWYVEGSWVLTGEPKTYTVSSTNNEVGGFGAPRVANPFSLKGDSWGAWELTARYSNTDLNYRNDLSTTNGGIFGGEERVIDLGVNWYLNQNVKLQVNDLITTVKKLSGPAGTQLGQDFNTIGVRLQFSN